MNIQDKWEKALKYTRIIRPRIQPLLTFDETKLSYIMLAESSINTKDTVVRKGEVVVEKPQLLLPSNSPQFEGFDFEGDISGKRDMVVNFLLVRGIQFPSFKYNNKTYSLEVVEKDIKKAVDIYYDSLQRQEDVFTGLIQGSDDCWQFSLLIFICSQAVKSAETDIKRLVEDLKNKKKK